MFQWILPNSQDAFSLFFASNQEYVLGKAIVFGAVIESPHLAMPLVFGVAPEQQAMFREPIGEFHDEPWVFVANFSPDSDTGRWTNQTQFSLSMVMMDYIQCIADCLNACGMQLLCCESTNDVGVFQLTIQPTRHRNVGEVTRDKILIHFFLQSQAFTRGFHLSHCDKRP